MFTQLEQVHGRPVVDKTGLSGIYDSDVTFVAPDESRMPGAPADAPQPEPGMASASEPGMTFLDAVERQLGLKLVSGKGPVKVLVVDKVNSKPTEN